MLIYKVWEQWYCRLELFQLGWVGLGYDVGKHLGLYRILEKFGNVGI